VARFLPSSTYYDVPNERQIGTQHIEWDLMLTVAEDAVDAVMVDADASDVTKALSA
jgi:hypothetical protein